MWDSINNEEVCEDICQYTNRSKMSRFDSMQTDDFMDKENLNQNLSPLKCEDISLYGTSSPVQSICTGTSPNHCNHITELDSNSQDSGYGASYLGENGKFLSYASPTRESAHSFGSGSLYSMEDEFLEDFADVEPLEKNSLPQDFNKLISGPLIQKTKPLMPSPKDTIIRPLFRRALSLQNTNNGTPSSSRVRSCLFKPSDSEVRNFKRPEPPSAAENGVIKRSRMFDDEDDIPSVPEQRPTLKRAFSATEESIMCAVQRSSTEPDLIGDFSKNFCLPLTRGRHQDLKSITSRTLASLMRGEFTESVATFKVIDCRYPYEFDGGHIDGAVNIYTKDQCSELLKEAEAAAAQDAQHRHILVFHCEFSSERGPNLYRYLRKEDRQKNISAYPSLNFPEIYLLEGGYKNFFEHFAEMCIPVAYKEMLHPDHETDLKHFRQKSKTWSMDSRQRPQRTSYLKRLL